jgi:hypothetical protein
VKEASVNSRKGRKKANVGAGGIEEVAGSLGVGVSKPSTSGEQDLAAEPGPSSRDKAGGKQKGKVAQDDENDDMYATEDDCDDEGGGEGTHEANVGVEEDVGEEAEQVADKNADPPPVRKKRKSLRNDEDKKKSATRPVKGPPTVLSKPTTPGTVSGPNIAQQETSPAGSDIPMTIDPVLETLQIPSDQPSPQAPGSGTST